MFDDEQGELLTVNEAARRLGLSASSVRRRIWSGELASVRLGDGSASPLRVHHADLDAYIRRHRAGGAA